MKSNHDIHTHNLFSICCEDSRATVPAMIAREEELGVEIYGLSNHMWDERVKGACHWYSHQTVAHALEAKYAYALYQGPVKLLFGAEIEYAYMGNILGISYENAVKFDYILVPHTHGFFMPEYPDRVLAKEKLAREIEQKMGIGADAAAGMANAAPADIIEAYAKEFSCDRHAHLVRHTLASLESLLENTELIRMAGAVPVSIAHPFDPCTAPRAERPTVTARLVDECADEITALCRKAAKLGIAMEINLSSISGNGGSIFTDNHPAVRLFRIMKEAGSRFTFGTDAHGLDELEIIHTADAFTKACGITEAACADWPCLR